MVTGSKTVKSAAIPAWRRPRRAMAGRGRLEAGEAADVTVFDPATISDRSTIEQTWLESVGVHHVLVGGQVVRSAGVTDRSVRPGVPILGGVA